MQEVRGNAVTKALRVLDAVARLETGRLAEIANTAAVTKPSAHRILTTLVDEGYVITDGAGRYSAGRQLRALAAQVYGREGTGIDTVLHDLQGEVGHTVHLAVRSREQATITYRVDSGKPYGVGSYVGMHLPLHATAIGKTILAWLPDEELHAIVDEGLTGYTAATVTDSVALAAELQQVRADGYAVEYGEHEESICAIAAPVLDAEARPLGSVSVTTVLFLVPLDELSALAPMVRRAANEVARRS